MKRGVNRVTLLGNVGSDPETRHFPSGGAVTNITLATSETWKDKQTDQDQERTEWHRLSFMDRGAYKLGEIAGKHITKGTKLYIEGALRTRKWQAKDGSDRYSTDIVVEEFQFVGSKPESDRPPAQSQAPAQSGAPAGEFADFDDDIPF